MRAQVRLLTHPLQLTCLNGSLRLPLPLHLPLLRVALLSAPPVLLQACLPHRPVPPALPPACRSQTRVRFAS